MKALIAYFSSAGENYVNGKICHLETGNTEIAANIIQQQTGADLFHLEPLVPYAETYSRCIAEAKDDQKRDARPELRQYPEHLEEYDTIYLGYPNYWGTMPMVVFTFLESYDFSGKTIYPFCTHEGSGMGKSEADIQRLCPGAKIAKGLPIHGANVKEEKQKIIEWINRR